MRRAKRKIIGCLVVFSIVCSFPFIIQKIPGEGIITHSNHEDELDQEQGMATSSGSVVCQPYWIAQSFKPNLPVLTRAEVRLMKLNDIASDVTLIIRDNLTGDDLTSVRVTSSLIGHNPSWIEFNFPDIDVQPGKTYYIICKTDGGDWPHKEMYKWSCTDLNPYPYGMVHCSIDEGKTWQKYNKYAIKDQCFRTYGLGKEENNPPGKPEKPIGPNSGKPGSACTYATFSVDPDGDRIYYMFDWGDGNESEWLGPYESGELVTVSHTWNTEGNYTIRIKAMDENGAESKWSDPLSVTVTSLHRKNVDIEKLMDGLFNGIIKWWYALLTYAGNDFF